MSLKIVHIFIIFLSICLTLFFGVWAVNEYQRSNDPSVLAWGVASLVGGFILIPYLIWFILKAKRTGLK